MSVKYTKSLELDLEDATQQIDELKDTIRLFVKENEQLELTVKTQKDSIHEVTDENEKSKEDYKRILSIKHRFEAVLTMLVELKDYKDSFGKDGHYCEHQPIAWKNARNLLSEGKKK